MVNMEEDDKMTDQKKDDLLRRLIPGPDGQSPVWLYPDGSHRCVTRFDVSDINAALAITRAQPVADDAGGDDKAWIKTTPHETYAGLLCQFRGLKSMVNSMGQQLSFYQKKSYETGEQHLTALKESLESERAMNAALTEELALRQPAAADNRGVDVDVLKRQAVIWYMGRFDSSDIIGMPSDREVLFDYIDHLTAQGLLRTTPEDAKGVILGYLHEVTEPDGQYHKMYSAQEESPWKHWKEDHQAGCRYKRTALFGATPQPEHEGE